LSDNRAGAGVRWPTRIVGRDAMEAAIDLGLTAIDPIEPPAGDN
jgi:hypothetical protein